MATARCNPHVELMRCIRSLLGSPLDATEDPNNTYVRFFLDEFKEPYGPNKTAVEQLLIMRLGLRELEVLPLSTCVSDLAASNMQKAVPFLRGLNAAVVEGLHHIVAASTPSEKLALTETVCNVVKLAYKDVVKLCVPYKAGKPLPMVVEANVCVLIKNVISELCGRPHHPDPPYRFFYGDALGLYYNNTCGMRQRLVQHLYFVRRQLSEMYGLATCIVLVPEEDRTPAECERLQTLLQAHQRIFETTQRCAAAIRQRLSLSVVVYDEEIITFISDILSTIINVCHPFDVAWASDYYSALVCGKTSDYTKTPAPLTKSCKTCAAPDNLEWVRLLPCSQCKTAVYCSKACQALDWKGHKQECGEVPIKKVAAPTGECANCALSGAPLFSCDRCKAEVYCGKACQTQHWKVGGHRRFCVPKQDRRPSKQDVGEPPSDCNTCVVCMDSLRSKRSSSLVCGHCLHTECIESIKAFGVAQVCPLCRSQSL